MASVHLDRLTLRYPSGAMGLAGVDLHVADGETIVLLGPAGSGKSTLLRAVAGTLTPSAGTVRLDERLIAGGGTLISPEKRGVGIVFPHHSVLPHWSVGRNVEFPLKQAHVAPGERARRARTALAVVGLGGYEERNPATLSTEHNLRIALARALVGDPRVLLLDEALSVLEPAVRERLRAEIHEIIRSGDLTAIHATDDRAEALSLADRLVVLERGRILQSGTAEQLRAAPASPFVARFLGDALTLRGTTDSGGFTATGVSLRLPTALLRGELPGRPGPAEIAIMPEAVVVSAAVASAPSAVVVAIAETPEGSECTLAWEGMQLHSRGSPYRPQVGETVALHVTQALLFPASATPRSRR